MASFFQPLTSTGDPVIAACNTDPKARQVYCNRLLLPSERLRTSLQRFTLVLSIFCLAFPLFVWAGQRVYQAVEENRKRGPNSGR